MFHRVKSEAQKVQNTVQENALRMQSQQTPQAQGSAAAPPAPSAAQRHALPPASNTNAFGTSRNYAQPEDNGTSQPAEARKTIHQQTDYQQKENNIMSEQTTASQSDQAQDDSKAAGKPLDLTAGGYSQPASQRTSSSPYVGNSPYPGYGKNDEKSRYSEASADRRLVIGQGITMSGEIESCDHLLVEGTIEAALKGAKVLEISETGTFYGTVEIGDATIAGRFEGDLTVDGCLVLKAGGVITGSISYRELQVESGAVIDGKLTPLRAQGEASEKKPVKGKQAPAKAAKSDNAQSSAANSDGQLFAETAAAE